MSPKQPDPTFAIIKEGILQWLSGLEHSPSVFQEFPASNRDLMEVATTEQDQIGWKSATRGFFSNQWKTLSDSNVLAGGTSQEGKGSHTMMLISKAIHELSRSLWLARNEALHGEQSQEMQTIRNADIAEMRELHAHPEHLPAGDRHYCEGTFDQLSRKSTSSKRRWLRHMRMVQARTIQEGTRQLPITDFFRRVDVRTPD
jgi:hypothetical protein